MKFGKDCPAFSYNLNGKLQKYTPNSVHYNISISQFGIEYKNLNRNFFFLIKGNSSLLSWK